MSKPHRLPDFDEQAVLETIQVRLVLPAEHARWNNLVRKHHYLKNAHLVGEQLRYVVTDDKGTWLALIGWSAAALHLKARDQSIEWTQEQRERRLHFLAQNSRFVILVKRQQLPNLATRAMSLCLKRLSADWQAQYKHPILMVESFVDRQLFHATAYKAGGWQALGRHGLQGRGLAGAGLQCGLQAGGGGLLPAAQSPQGTLGQGTRPSCLAVAARQAIARAPGPV